MATRTSEPSLGELVARAAGELSALVRDEVALAKAELTAEVGKVGKGAGLFGGASVTGHLAVLFLSFAAMFGLGQVVPMWAAALTVGLVFAVVTLGLVLAGKATFGSVSAVPRRTVQTLEEDVEWARHRKS